MWYMLGGEGKSPGGNKMCFWGWNVSSSSSLSEFRVINVPYSWSEGGGSLNSLRCEGLLIASIKVVLRLLREKPRE